MLRLATGVTTQFRYLSHRQIVPASRFLKVIGVLISINVQNVASMGLNYEPNL